MAVVNAHDFHFVMDRKMKEKLKGMDCFGGLMSLSGIIVRIMKLLIPVIGNEHTWGEQRMSKYLNVSDDPDEVREDIHVYLPPGLYRKLKLLHQDLNFYSIAQLLREFLKFFLRLIDVYGGDVLQVLKKSFDRWKDEEKQDRQTLRKSVQQLFAILRHLPGKNRLVTVYDDSYTPFWILRT